MKKLFSLFGLFGLFALHSFAWAHHTKDHMVLVQNTDEIVAATKEGANGAWVILVWVVVLILIVSGFVRWWQGRNKS
ncbi:MAG: hypothetical protein OEY67_05540 [Gammaproteobacteria bacterium]|nr:hypothetical protein [Gammaproteobacteria bacterium]